MRGLKLVSPLGLFFWALSLAGCPDPASGKLSEVGIYPRELWGEWIRMDTGKTWYIRSNFISSTDQYGNSSGLSLSRQSENVIQVKESVNSGKNEKVYYLYASRTANASFTGTVARFDSSVKAAERAVAGGKGWIDVVVQDLNNGDTTEVQTDADGAFEVENVIPGDAYLVSPEGGNGTIVIPKDDGDDVGTITITEGMNFKTRISAAASVFYMDTMYPVTITVENTGTEDCLAATYAISSSDSLVPGSSGILGTIEPGKTKSFSLTVSCPPFVDGDYTYKKIQIEITDRINNKTWHDSVSLKFHRAAAKFYVRSEFAVSGIIITPASGTYFFKTERSGYPSQNFQKAIEVPWSSRDYLVVFSGASADTETVYSLGIGVSPDTGFASFIDLGNYEPNNTENTATFLGSQDPIMSYLHKNDIDYYRISLR